MPRYAPAQRVLGPYREPTHSGERWRIVVVSASSRVSRFAPTEDAARRLMRTIAAKSMPPPPPVRMTVDESVRLYVADRVRVGAWDEATVGRALYDLRELLAVAPTQIASVGPRTLRAYIDSLAGRSLYSQEQRYNAIRRYFRWATRHGHCRTDPTLAIDPDDLPWRTRRGRRLIAEQLGKRQLCGQHVAYARAAAHLKTASERVGAMLPLLLGMASGEVTHLQVRDVSWQTGELTVAAKPGWKPKTTNRARRLVIPTQLAADLHELTDGRPADAWLLMSRESLGRAPIDMKTLRRWVYITCDAAGLPRVCPHGLRGTWSTLYGESMARLREVPVDDIPAVVGRGLGHGDDGGAVASRHYYRGTTAVPSLSIPV